MPFDAAAILELVGLETILAGLFVGALASSIYLRNRQKPISLGLLGPDADDRR